MWTYTCSRLYVKDNIYRNWLFTKIRKKFEMRPPPLDKFLDTRLPRFATRDCYFKLSFRYEEENVQWLANWFLGTSQGTRWGACICWYLFRNELHLIVNISCTFVVTFTTWWMHFKYYRYLQHGIFKKNIKNIEHNNFGVKPQVLQSNA